MTRWYYNNSRISILLHPKRKFSWVGITIEVALFCTWQCKNYQFKAKDSKIKPYSLCVGNISKGFPVDNMKKPELNGCVYDFSVDCNTSIFKVSD